MWAVREAWAGASGPLLLLGPGVAAQSPCLLHVLAVVFLEVAVGWGLHGGPKVGFLPQGFSSCIQYI